MRTSVSGLVRRRFFRTHGRGHTASGAVENVGLPRRTETRDSYNLGLSSHSCGARNARKVSGLARRSSARGRVSLLTREARTKRAGHPGSSALERGTSLFRCSCCAGFVRDAVAVDVDSAERLGGTVDGQRARIRDGCTRMVLRQPFDPGLEPSSRCHSMRSASSMSFTASKNSSG